MSLFQKKYHNTVFQLTADELKLYSEDTKNFITSIPKAMAWRMALDVLNNLASELMYEYDALDWAVNVWVNDTYSLSFNKAIDPTKFVFTLKNYKWNSVAGTWAWDVSHKIYTFTPTSALLFGIKYIATFSAVTTGWLSAIDSSSFTTLAGSNS
jgi:hypothetical protein